MFFSFTYWNNYTSLADNCTLTKHIKFRHFSRISQTKKPKTKIGEKERAPFYSALLMRHRGFEPRTTWLKVKCSTNWANIPSLAFTRPNWASWIRTSVMQESKSCALPLGDSPLSLIQGGYRDSNPGPPEPQSGALTNCAIPTIYSHRPMWPGQTCPKGFEPLTHGLEGRCSIQLSYEHITFVSSRRTYHSSRILY